MEMVVITKDYLGSGIEFKVIDGKIYGNANSMAKSFGGSPKIADWKRSNGTIRYIEAMEKSHRDIELIKSNDGADAGTWIHEKLILNFARYLDVEFEIWADEQIATLLRDGEVRLKPTMPQSYAQALLEAGRLALEVENLQLANADLEKTKAYISDKKTATAMNTASQLSKKVDKLEIELDKTMNWSTIKRMELKYHGIKFDWRKLKSASKDLGIEPIEVFDSNYGTVKSYHREAWVETYALEI